MSGARSSHTSIIDVTRLDRVTARRIFRNDAEGEGNARSIAAELRYCLAERTAASLRAEEFSKENGEGVVVNGLGVVN